jgi:hypothetical protein
MFGPLLQIVLQATGSLAMRVKKLQSEVDQIQRRVEAENVIALATGLEQAAKALALPVRNDDSSRFRVTRLHSALDNLDEAWVRAKTTQGSTSKQTQVIIRFAQGLCAVAIPGGVEAAKIYSEESLECLRVESQKFQEAAAADRESMEFIRLEEIGPTGEVLPDVRPEWEEKIVTYKPAFAMRVKLGEVEEYKIVKKFGNTRSERMGAYEQRAQRCSLAAARRDSLFKNVEALLQAASSNVQA